jgi:acyl carrier protein
VVFNNKENIMEKIVDLVIKTVQEVGYDQENQALIEANKDTLLFGENLDSMGIVFLVTDLESKISEKLNIDITLADERAMSQKTSPFRSIKTLAKYVQTLIDEEQAS